MKAVLAFVLLLAGALVFTGCNYSWTDKVYDKGVKAYKVGEKVHQALEKAGKGARKAGEVYVNFRGEKEDPKQTSPSK